MKTKTPVLGVDIGKSACSLVGLGASGALALRRRAKRETFVGLAAQWSPCVVAREACCGAHHLRRLFAAHGHDARLMSPEYVRLHVKFAALAPFAKLAKLLAEWLPVGGAI